MIQERAQLAKEKEDEAASDDLRSLFSALQGIGYESDGAGEEPPTVASKPTAVPQLAALSGSWEAAAQVRELMALSRSQRLFWRATNGGMHESALSPMHLQRALAADWGGLNRHYRVNGRDRQFLTALDLSGVAIGSQGADAISANLPGSLLVELRLTNSSIGPLGIACLAHGICQTHSLQLCDLRDNPAGGNTSSVPMARWNSMTEKHLVCFLLYGFLKPVRGLVRLGTVQGGFALAAAVSHPGSVLSTLALSFNTLPAADMLPWPSDSEPPPVWDPGQYSAVVTAFAEALPHSFLSVLDIGYATSTTVRAATLGQPSVRGLEHRGAQWLGMDASALVDELRLPLQKHALELLLGAEQRLAWARATVGSQAQRWCQQVALLVGRPAGT